MGDGLPNLLDELVPSVQLSSRALAIANALAHPAPNCFYLALAELRGAQMVTAGRRPLGRVARTPGARGARPGPPPGAPVPPLFADHPRPPIRCVHARETAHGPRPRRPARLCA